MTNIENIVEKKKFTQEEMERYYAENSYKFAEDFKPSDKCIKCIDDRADEPHAKERIGLPGAGLGILPAVLGAIYLIEKKYQTLLPIKYNKIAKDIEGLIGVSLHTDEKNKELGDAIVCQGCGHIMKILSSQNEISEASKAFLKDEYLVELKEKQKNGEIEVPAYAGGHNARAVVIIKDLETGLKSKDAHDQVYVYNEAWHLKILTDFSLILTENLKSEIKDITNEEVKEFLLQAANSQLHATVEHLAPDLPMYIVYNDKIEERKKAQ